MKLKMTLEFNYEIDGEAKLDKNEVRNLLFDHCLADGFVIMSEDVDGTEDYAILVNSVNLM